MTKVIMLTILVSLTSISYAQAQQLFASDSTLEAQLEAPLSELFAHKSDSADFHDWKKFRVDGVLKVGLESLPVYVKMRGFSTLEGCRFPKLNLKFKSPPPNSSLFNRLSEIDLGTHCDPLPNYRSYLGSMAHNEREVVIYKWLKILGIVSYSARASRMTYIDSSATSSVAMATESAMFLEHISSLLERLSGIEIRAVRDKNSTDVDSKTHIYEYTQLGDHPQIDLHELARIELFLGLIGDSDHFLTNKIWNYKLVQLPDSRWLPIPLDFDLSQLAQGRANAGLTAAHPHFDLLSSEEKKTLASNFLVKLPELKNALALLSDDAEGMNAFATTLTSQRATLEAFASGGL